ncbi:hypothetical protein [Ruegeria sp. MALMAid1280]|uniref:hypothetical protein n=1 Tax=Ruegeria sp. MALMAid1280 TaxID=3411634 RepID=UPI003BA1D69E
METSTHTTEKCCSKRPRFFRDQLLTADLFNGAQDHPRELLWQHNRSVYGSGVVHGLWIKDRKEGLFIGPGLAIDPRGRMLEVGEEGMEVDLEDTFCCGPGMPTPGRYTLRLHFGERTWPPQANPGCGPHDPEASWICSGVRVSLCTGCEACDPCACPEIACCNDACGYVCGRQGSGPGVAMDPELDQAMACLPLLEEHCDGWVWDPGGGVPLACVDLVEIRDPKGCEEGYKLCLADIDPCTVRRHIYRNRQLFELIQQCHVTRPRLLRPEWLPDWNGVGLPHLPWDAFAAQCQDKSGGFALNFSHTMRVEGIHEASIFLSAVTMERRTDYHEARRIPLRKLITDRHKEHDGADYAGEVRLLVEAEWLDAEVDGTRSTLFDGFLAELTLRGAMLRDRCNTMLDARPPGAAKGPEHVRNGDDLVIAFRVGPKGGASKTGDQT